MKTIETLNSTNNTQKPATRTLRALGSNIIHLLEPFPQEAPDYMSNHYQTTIHQHFDTEDILMEDLEHRDDFVVWRPELDGRDVT